MSLLSSVILPEVEKSLVGMKPEMIRFLMSQVQTIGSELLEWVERKLDNPVFHDEDVPQ